MEGVQNEESGNTWLGRLKERVLGGRGNNWDKTMMISGDEGALVKCCCSNEDILSCIIILSSGSSWLDCVHLKENLAYYNLFGWPFSVCECLLLYTYRVTHAGTPKERLKEFFPVLLGRVGGLNQDFATYIIMESDYLKGCCHLFLLSEFRFEDDVIMLFVNFPFSFVLCSLIILPSTVGWLCCSQ